MDAGELPQLLRALISAAEAGLAADANGEFELERLERVRRAGLEVGKLAKKIRLLDLAQGPGLEAAVRRAILDEMMSGGSSLPHIASRLGLSPRVLQIRLQSSGRSYTSVLDDVRREVSEHYLRRPELSSLDVAILVGYSDSSAFHRAFKRWTGRTPGGFRSTIDER